MNHHFGADEWAANWDQPTSSTPIYSDTGAVTPYYLAKTVPDQSVPVSSGYNVDTSNPSVPYYLAPNVQQPSQNSQPVQEGSSSGSSIDVGGIFRTVVDIFGRRVQQPPMQRMPVEAPIPTWVYIAIPAAVIGVIAVIAMSSRKSSVAGYRGKHKRSRR